MTNRRGQSTVRATTSSIKTREQPKRNAKVQNLSIKSTKCEQDDTNLTATKKIDKKASKFLNCPICNGLLRNSNDLNIHLSESHSLDDVSINTIVKEVDTTNKQPSDELLQILRPFKVNNSQSRETCSDVDEDMNEDESDTDVSFDEDDDLSDYEENETPIINYKDEINMICDYLNLEYKKDVKFIELKLLYGKCFICDLKPATSLIDHINEIHSTTTINQLTLNSQCFLCGLSLKTRKKLITHQYKQHGLISFTTVNHVCKMTLDKKFKANLKYNRKNKKRNGNLDNYTVTKKAVYTDSEGSVEGSVTTNDSNEQLAIQFIQNELDPLYDQSISETKFAVLLMLKLFKRTELIGKQIAAEPDQCVSNTTPSPLPSCINQQDERVEFIRKAIEKRFNPLGMDACWSRSLRAMNDKIQTLKPKDYTTTEEEEEEEEFERERAFIYKLMNTSIKSDELQELLKKRIEQAESRNYLNKCEIRRLFNDFETPHHFATNLMLKLFKRGELDPSFNVYGRTYKKDVEPKMPLDPDRVNYIRLMTFKHFNVSNKKLCWAKCVRTMNNKIRNMSRSGSATGTNGTTKPAVAPTTPHKKPDEVAEPPKQITHFSDDLINHLNETVGSYDLGKNELDFIYESVETPFNFCARLLLKIFTKCELLNSNVYGRIFNRLHDHKQALDETRVAYIHDRMFEYYPCGSDGDRKLCWARCVKAMNDKLSYIQKLYRLHQTKTDDKRRESIDELKEEGREEEEQERAQKLTKEEISYLFRSTVSPAHFSVRLLLKVFTTHELNTGKNVYGRTYRRDVVQKEALDANRIDFIYETVFKYYPNENRKTCWSKCIKSMNDKIRYINKYYLQK